MADIFGSDISTYLADGTTDIDPLWAEIREERVVLEHCARCLDTEYGTLPGAPEFGFDLKGLIGKRLSNVAILRVKDRIKEVLERCIEAVQTATVTRFEEVTPQSWRISISITVATGPFTLVLAVSPTLLAILRADRG